MTPTQRTIKALRARGFEVGIVERWNQYVVRADGGRGIRQDLFGFIDVVAIGPEGIVGVQCCGGSTHAAHRRQILENDKAPKWLQAGGSIQLWSWAKRKVKRGGKLRKWKPRVEEIGLGMFDN